VWPNTLLYSTSTRSQNSFNVWTRTLKMWKCWYTRTLRRQYFLRMSTNKESAAVCAELCSIRSAQPTSILSPFIYFLAFQKHYSFASFSTTEVCTSVSCWKQFRVFKSTTVLRHVCSKRELWSQRNSRCYRTALKRYSFLGNGIKTNGTTSVSRQKIRNKQE
jgi:hypothetical protein